MLWLLFAQFANGENLEGIRNHYFFFPPPVAQRHTQKHSLIGTKERRKHQAVTRGYRSGSCVNVTIAAHHNKKKNRRRPSFFRSPLLNQTKNQTYKERDEKKIVPTLTQKERNQNKKDKRNVLFQDVGERTLKGQAQ